MQMKGLDAMLWLVDKTEGRRGERREGLEFKHNYSAQISMGNCPMRQVEFRNRKRDHI